VVVFDKGSSGLCNGLIMVILVTPVRDDPADRVDSSAVVSFCSVREVLLSISFVFSLPSVYHNLLYKTAIAV